MSVRLMSDVFRNVHGIPSGRRMLLVVLADFANDEGICWPSIKSLATNADLGERHVSAELKELAKDGFLSIEEVPGKSNHYRLHIPQGMNHSSGVKSSKGVSHSSGVNHSASRTTVQGRDEPQATPTPEPQATPPLNHSSSEPLENHQREPSRNHQVGTRNEIHKLVDAWTERRGFPPANWSKASKIAKDLQKAGVTPGELLEIYDWLEADPFWSDDKGFDLGTALSQVDKFRQSKRRPRVAKKTYLEKTMEVMAEVFGESADVDADVYETTGVVR